MERGVGEEACVAAALLGSGSRNDHNDLLSAIEAPHDGNLQRHIEQLRRLTRTQKKSHYHYDDDALLLSVLAGFPDRVARKRAGSQILLASGTSAELTGGTTAYDFMVAVDVEDRKEKPLPVVRMTARIEPEWLIDLFPDRVREHTGVMWNESAQRVEAVSTLQYDELVLQESRDMTPDDQIAAQILSQKALEAGIERFVSAETLEDFMARVEFAGLEPPDIAQALSSLCFGLRSFTELKRAASDFVFMLERSMNGQRLHEIAPVSIRLQNGRQTKIHYERGKPPWIASRL
jgi:ATP-dependent helicase HrpB